MGSSSTKVDNKYSREPTFKFEGSRDLAQGLLQNVNQSMFDPNNTWKEQGLGFLSNMVSGEPVQWQPSQQLQNQITSIYDQSANALPDQLAAARSQYYRAPAGRAAMGLDEAVMNNQLMADSQVANLMANQYNQDVGMMANAANNLITTDASNFTQAMQLLSAITGEKGHGSSNTSSGGGLASTLGGLGGFAMGLGSMGFSDRSLKNNIKEVGTYKGFPLYTFEYKFIPGITVEGLMADEVKAERPDAVFDIAGYDAIDYGAL